MEVAQNIRETKLKRAGKQVDIVWADGKRERFHALWLRDHCTCLHCRHPNGQKLTNINDFPEAVKIEAVQCEGQGLRVVFSPDQHSAYFKDTWLREVIADNAQPATALWDTGTLSIPDISRDYAVVSGSDDALVEWLGLVVHYGCAVLRGVPTATNTVCRIVEWFGYVCETNYGRVFEVRSASDPNNLAYTDLPLSVHTDNPYRDPPPGLQLLHCLQNSAAGGDSILVDGFMAAQILAQENATHYHELSRYAIPFRFCDADVDLRNRLPVLEVVGGNLRAVNFNNRSFAVLDLPFETQLVYYHAYRHFFEILQRTELNLQYQMNSGDLFLFDNRRILHGRTGFSGGGARHLQGCYANRDALLSKWITLRDHSVTAKPIQPIS